MKNDYDKILIMNSDKVTEEEVIENGRDIPKFTEVKC